MFSTLVLQHLTTSQLPVSAIRARAHFCDIYAEIHRGDDKVWIPLKKMGQRCGYIVFLENFTGCISPLDFTP